MPAILLASWVTLLSDSPVDDLKPFKLISQLEREARSIGLLHVIDKYSRLYDTLVSTIYARDGLQTRPFLSEFKDTPIFREYLHWFRTGSTSTFKFISTFLRFGKKCEFGLDDFKTRAFRSWSDVEDRLNALSCDVALSRELRAILTALLPRVPRDVVFRGKHGSGAVSGPERGTISKCQAMTLNAKLRLLLSTASPFRTSSYLLESAVADGGAIDQAARLMFVPKNYKTARSICMEPTNMMYMQQHVRAYLEDAISASLLGRFVQIDNQKRNQDGALYGSRTNLVDTLDLTAASDSVSVDLVRKVFPRDWLIGLLATRSSRVTLPDGSVRVVSKFAPMGSALCFPVQSILYAGVVILAYMRHAFGTTPVDTFSAHEIRAFVEKQIAQSWRTSHSYESFAVYGDDIICDTRITEEVIAILLDLGFTVNSEKSFIGPQAFRESCGMYALSGADVTPFNFKAKELGRTFEARSLASFVDLTNEAGNLGFFKLHSFLIHLLLHWGSKRGQNPILFTGSAKVERDFLGPRLNTSVFSRNPHNSHLPKRDCVPLQREEFRSWRIRHRSRTRQIDVEGDRYDRYLLDLFYRSGESGDMESLAGSSDELRGAVIRRLWTPMY